MSNNYIWMSLHAKYYGNSKIQVKNLKKGTIKKSKYQLIFCLFLKQVIKQNWNCYIVIEECNKEKNTKQ